MRRLPRDGWRPGELLAREGDPTVRPRKRGLSALDSERRHEGSDSERNPSRDTAPAWRSDGDTGRSFLWARRPKTDRTPDTAHPPERELDRARAPHIAPAGPVVVEEMHASRIKPRWLLAVLLEAMFMTQADATIVNLAGPSIRSDLGASGAELELVLGGYFLVGVAAFGTAYLGLVSGPGAAPATPAFIATGLALTALGAAAAAYRSTHSAVCWPSRPAPSRPATSSIRSWRSAPVAERGDTAIRAR